MFNHALGDVIWGSLLYIGCSNDFPFTVVFKATPRAFAMATPIRVEVKRVPGPGLVEICEIFEAVM